MRCWLSERHIKEESFRATYLANITELNELLQEFNLFATFYFLQILRDQILHRGWDGKRRNILEVSISFTWKLLRDGNFTSIRFFPDVNNLYPESFWSWKITSNENERTRRFKMLAALIRSFIHKGTQI